MDRAFLYRHRDLLGKIHALQAVLSPAAATSLRDGTPVEVVSKLLGHSSVTITLAVYGHPTAEDARRYLGLMAYLEPNGTAAASLG